MRGAFTNAYSAAPRLMTIAAPRINTSAVSGMSKVMGCGAFSTVSMFRISGRGRDMISGVKSAKTQSQSTNKAP